MNYGAAPPKGGYIGGGGGGNETRHLIEPNAKYFLYRTLQKCHEIKIRYFSLWVNLAVFLVFCGGLFVVLYYKYKGRMSPYEQRQRMLRDQQYILSKIRYYHDERKRATYSHIDELPSKNV